MNELINALYEPTDANNEIPVARLNFIIEGIYVFNFILNFICIFRNAFTRTL